MRQTNRVECDVLVIGGGLAGCLAAITAKQSGAGKVVLADKGKVSRSGQSVFAAGIWALRLPEDPLDVWMEETIVQGDYLNDQEWVKLLWERDYEVAVSVDEWCREKGREAFEHDSNGNFVRRRSRGHIKTSHAVINSVPMMEGLRQKARSLGVELVERVMVTDIVRGDVGGVGAVGFNYREGEAYIFKAKAIVLAAAGAGFKSIFMGHRNLTGDLQAAAYREGLILRNMENISHNTCAREYDIHGMNLYVGVGGKWLNSQGEEFMWDYDPILGNRANQPTKCIALAREVHEGRGPILFDMSAASLSDRELCRKILPESFRLWDAAGIDPFVTPVEWSTAFYGTIINGGGLHIDTSCATNAPGVFAAGDLTCIPPHGGYSFGGVNIAFCAVSGVVAGESSARYCQQDQGPGMPDKELTAKAGLKIKEALSPLLKRDGYPADEAISDVQSAIFPYKVSLIKNKGSLEAALAKITAVKERFSDIVARDEHELVKANEAKNLATLADLMIRASLFRKESRGFHFREDYPIMDNVNWLKWVMVQHGEDGNPKLWTEKVATPYVKPSAPLMRHRSLRQKVTSEVES